MIDIVIGAGRMNLTVSLGLISSEVKKPGIQPMPNKNLPRSALAPQ
jgi:hypothetical protein